MWAAERLLKDTNLFNASVFGLGMGISLLGGHPETAFHIWIINSVYFIARIALDRQELPHKTRVIGLFFCGNIIGLLVSGVLLLPFLDFMFQSSTFAQGGRSMVKAGSNFFFSEDAWANLSTLITLVCPNFFGNPVDHNYIWPFHSVYQNYNEQSIYFGLVPMVLAVGAIFSKQRQRAFVIIAFLALFCIGVALRLPGFEIINHLPFFSMARNQRFRLPFAFLSAVMAGFGFDIFFCKKTPGSVHLKRPLYACFVVIMTTLLLFLVVSVLRLSPTISSLLPESPLYSFFYSIFSFGQMKTYITMISAVILLIVYIICLKYGKMRSTFQIILIGVTFIELCALGWDYNPTVVESDIFPNIDAVLFMKNREQQPFRILPTDYLFRPNFFSAYGMDSVSGYDLPVFKRYSDLYIAQGGKIDYRQNWSPYWPLIDFLNVKYVIARRALNLDKFIPVFQSDYFTIYENLQALPRAFMVYDSEVIKDSRVILDRLISGQHDFTGKILFEEPFQIPVQNSPDIKTEYSVAFSRYSNDEAVLSVFSNKPGFLVMSDLYTPDWRAKLDNRKVKIYRANYAYRAIYVPEGRHVINFQYVPQSFIVGVAMTCAGILVVMLLCLIRVVQHRG
jgi:hypothetical protein